MGRNGIRAARMTVPTGEVPTVTLTDDKKKKPKKRNKRNNPDISCVSEEEAQWENLPSNALARILQLVHPEPCKFGCIGEHFPELRLVNKAWREAYDGLVQEIHPRADQPVREQHLRLLSSLRNLKKIDLQRHYNLDEDGINEMLFHTNNAPRCAKLTELDARGCHFDTKAHLQLLGTLTTLQSFMFTAEGVTVEGMRCLEGLTNLTTLVMQEFVPDLWEHQPIDDSWGCIGSTRDWLQEDPNARSLLSILHLTNLRELALRDAEAPGFAVEQLSSMISLTSLALYSPKIQGLVDALPKLAHLVALELVGNCEWESNTLDHVSCLTNLQQLTFEHLNESQWSVVRPLVKLISLTFKSRDDNYLELGPQFWQHVTQLKSLIFDGCGDSVDIRCAASAMHDLPHLLRFVALGYQGLYVRDIMPSNFPHTRLQAFITDVTLGDKGLLALTQMTQLQRLKLLSCEWMTDKGLLALHTLQDLQELALCHTEKVTNAGLANLRPLTKLITLDLTCWRGITFTGLHHLQHLVNLQHLNLDGCSLRVAQKCAEVLRPGVGKLSVLHCDWKPRYVTKYGDFERLHDHDRLRKYDCFCMRCAYSGIQCD